ncbi:MAG: alcohol dehydrogenase catalytic domain-containing protein [Planctomycetaceae bacterium]
MPGRRFSATIVPAGQENRAPAHPGERMAAMRAMLLERTGELAAGTHPLRLADLPVPAPGSREIRLRVTVCGVCRTELDEVEGRAPPPSLPVVPGHQVVGIVDALGPAARRYRLGERVGVGWIHHSSGEPDENLSPAFTATGRDVNGGYAEYMTVPEDYAHPIPAVFSDAEAAPLLCAGAVGFRALRLTGLADGQTLGLTGFGSSAHLVLQFARHRYPRSRIFVFARNPREREFAAELGAHWTGATEARAPALLDAIIDTTPLQMFVMAADIRESTLLMKEAVQFEQFAKIMDKFVSAVRSGIGTPGGWFDKFTGDGFLAYWVVQTSSREEYQRGFVEAAGNLAHTAHQLIELFHRRVLEDFRRNSRNLSDGVGLSIGLDAGPGFVVEIAGELTVVGPPVVGAVRMVSAASQPQEIFANVYLGEHLRDEQDGIYEALGMRATRESRPTKEYPKGQEVYALTFADAASEE